MYENVLFVPPSMSTKHEFGPSQYDLQRRRIGCEQEFFLSFFLFTILKCDQIGNHPQ
jgi:hypothetical protein